MPVFSTLGSLAEFRQGYTKPNKPNSLTFNRGLGYDLSVLITPGNVIPPGLPESYYAITSPLLYSNTSNTTTIQFLKMDPYYNYDVAVYANNIAGNSSATSANYYMSSNIVANGNITIANASAFTISPNGGEVDVTTSSGRLLRYTRNANTGQLTLLSNTSIANINLTSVVYSADGNFLYMYGTNTSSNVNTIYNYRISNSTVISSIVTNALTGNTFYVNQNFLYSSPDNKSIIATGYEEISFGNLRPHIWNYSRNTTSGNLTLYQSNFIPVLSNTATANTFVSAMVIPDNNNTLYLAVSDGATTSRADISVYSRNTSNTYLAHVSTVNLYQNTTATLYDIKSTDDYTSVYVSQHPYSLYTYSRNTSTGNLSFIQTSNTSTVIPDTIITPANSAVFTPSKSFSRNPGSGTLTLESSSSSFSNASTKNAVISNDNRNIYALSGSILTIFNITQ